MDYHITLTEAEKNMQSLRLCGEWDEFKCESTFTWYYSSLKLFDTVLICKGQYVKHVKTVVACQVIIMLSFQSNEHYPLL